MSRNSVSALRQPAPRPRGRVRVHRRRAIGALLAISTWALVGSLFARPAAMPPPVATAGDRTQETESLRRALRAYVSGQEAYFAEHVTYASAPRDLEDYLPEMDDTVAWTIVASSPRGHSAVATDRSRVDVMCGVAMGEAPPPLLDDADPGGITCPARQVGTVRPSAPMGLLLGIAGRTLWIVFDGDSATLAAAGPGIITPRDDGFWRFDTTTDARGLQMLVADAPSGRRDTVVRWEDDLDPARYNTLRMRFTFLGPRYLGYSLYAERPDDIRPDFMAGFGEYAMLGPDLEPTELTGLVDHAPTLAILEGTADYCDAGWSWTIVRGRGRWEYQAFYNTGVRICGFGSRETSVQPDRELVGHPPISLAFVRQVVPRATDAVPSPRGDGVVALTPDSIYAFTVSPTAVGAPRAVAAAPGQTIVMAEWALGRHVRRWTDEVRALLAARLER